MLPFPPSLCPGKILSPSLTLLSQVKYTPVQPQLFFKSLTLIFRLPLKSSKYHEVYFFSLTIIVHVYISQWILDSIHLFYNEKDSIIADDWFPVWLQTTDAALLKPPVPLTLSPTSLSALHGAHPFYNTRWVFRSRFFLWFQHFSPRYFSKSRRYKK